MQTLVASERSNTKRSALGGPNPVADARAGRAGSLDSPQAALRPCASHELLPELTVRDAMAMIKRVLAPLRPAPWDVDDLVHDVLMHVLIRLRAGEVIDNPRAFVCAAARNAFLTRIRNRRYDAAKAERFAQTLTILPHCPGPDDTVLLREVFARIDDGSVRQLFILWVLSGWTVTEAAAAMQISRSKARRLVTRLTVLLTSSTNGEA